MAFDIKEYSIVMWRDPPDKPKACARCGDMFRPLSYAAKYCIDCRPIVHAEQDREWYRGTKKYKKSRKCDRCGDEIIFAPHNGATKYCGICAPLVREELITARNDRRRRGFKPIGCNRCGVVFRPTGAMAKFCDVCRPIAFAERKKQTYLKNHDWHLAKGKENREAHPDRQKQWKKDNPGYGKQWYRKNHKKALARAKKWRDDNPHIIRMQGKQRLARKRAVYNAPYTENEFLLQLVEQSYLDFYTDEPLFNGSIKPDITEEHIIPIVHKGPDTLDNIVFIRRVTNSSKNSRRATVFLAELVSEGVITQEAADRKLKYLREKLSRIMTQTWLCEWYSVGEFEDIIKEHLG